MSSTAIFYRCGCRAGTTKPHPQSDIYGPHHLCPEVLPHVCATCQHQLDTLFRSPDIPGLIKAREVERQASAAAEAVEKATLSARGMNANAAGRRKREERRGKVGGSLQRAREARERYRMEEGEGEGEEEVVLERARLIARLRASEVREE